MLCIICKPRRIDLGINDQIKCIQKYLILLQTNDNGPVPESDKNRHFCRQPDLGIFIPECNPEDGAFLAEQCNITAGVCWCVDEKGHEKPNSRVRVQPGTRDCKVAIIKSNEKNKGEFLLFEVKDLVKLALTSKNKQLSATFIVTA